MKTILFTFMALVLTAQTSNVYLTTAAEQESAKRAWQSLKEAEKTWAAQKALTKAGHGLGLKDEIDFNKEFTTFKVKTESDITAGSSWISGPNNNCLNSRGQLVSCSNGK